MAPLPSLATAVNTRSTMIASDPVESGLVSSFNHPGGNVTGEGYLNAQLAPKRLQLRGSSRGGPDHAAR